MMLSLQRFGSEHYFRVLPPLAWLEVANQRIAMEVYPSTLRAQPPSSARGQRFDNDKTLSEHRASSSSPVRFSSSNINQPPRTICKIARSYFVAAYATI